MSTNLPPRSLPPEKEPVSSIPEARKDQYSLEEMMKALRDKEREKDEKGEVVTRSDGTVARKVKRRRRRSDQPEKPTPETEKKRLLLKVVLCAVLVLATCLTGLFLVLRQNSKGHVETLETQTAEWTGAKVNFKGFKRMPFSASMQGASFVWDQESFIKSLELQAVSGDVRFFNFLGARPSGLQIGGLTGQMVVGNALGRSEPENPLEEEDFPFNFKQYFCESLNVSFGEGAPIGFKGASVGLRSIGQEGYQVTLDQGFFRLEGWEDLPIANGLIRYKNGVLTVNSLSLEHPVVGSSTLAHDLEMSGEIPLKNGQKVELEISTEEFPLEVLVGKKLARLMSGSIVSSKGKVSYTVGNRYFDEIEIGFSARSTKLARFPFLANLHSLFPENNLDQLEFGEGISKIPITGTLRILPEGVVIENLDMALKGKVKFRGSFGVGKLGNIAGDVELWVNRFFLTSQERFKNSPLLLGTEASGFVKVEFDVKGTLDEPDDGFLGEIGVDSTTVRPPETGKDGGVWERLQRGEEKPLPIPNFDDLDGE